nr:uncharacterized protein LOC127303114 [Lolium perenne]
MRELRRGRLRRRPAPALFPVRRAAHPAVVDSSYAAPLPAARTINGSQAAPQRRVLAKQQRTAAPPHLGLKLHQLARAKPQQLACMQQLQCPAPSEQVRPCVGSSKIAATALACIRASSSAAARIQAAYVGQQHHDLPAASSPPTSASRTAASTFGFASSSVGLLRASPAPSTSSTRAAATTFASRPCQRPSGFSPLQLPPAATASAAISGFRRARKPATSPRPTPAATGSASFAPRHGHLRLPGDTASWGLRPPRPPPATRAPASTPATPAAPCAPSAGSTSSTDCGKREIKGKVDPAGEMAG